MLKELEKVLGVKLKSFKWIGGFSKANRNHFVEFNGWDGEIYVVNKGIITITEYYKLMVNKGFCLYVDGMIVAKEGFSDHYNSLHKHHLGRLNQSKVKKENTGYPVIDPSEKAAFQCAVDLYKMGILSLEQLAVRVKKYIKPEQQESVLISIQHQQAA